MLSSTTTCALHILSMQKKLPKLWSMLEMLPKLHIKPFMKYIDSSQCHARHVLAAAS